MKREIRVVDEARQIVCCTYPDERWYMRELPDGQGGKVPEFVPSTTWICSYYPKGERFIRWIGKTGWDEAEEIKWAAGDRGSKTHQGVSRLVHGGTIGMGDLFENPRTLQQEPLSAEEYFNLMTFAEWCEKERPEFIANELTVWSERYRYAGTLDLLCRIKSDGYRFPRIIDVKTSANIYPEMELQVSSYKHADIAIPKNTKLAILQVGYKKNKVQKYKLTPVPDRFGLFLATRRVWKTETADQRPFQREYPLSLSLSPELTLKEKGLAA